MQGRPQGGVRGRGVPAGERAGVPRRGADGESVSRVVVGQSAPQLYPMLTIVSDNSLPLFCSLLLMSTIVLS